jgi:hypothetical protein
MKFAANLSALALAISPALAVVSTRGQCHNYGRASDKFVKVTGTNFMLNGAKHTVVGYVLDTLRIEFDLAYFPLGAILIGLD